MYAGGGSDIVSAVWWKVEPEAIVLVSGWSSMAAILGKSTLRLHWWRRQRALLMKKTMTRKTGKKEIVG